VRFTVRRMMVAVAIFAVALGVGIELIRLKRFRDHFAEQARDHGLWEIFYSNMEQSSRETAAVFENSIEMTTGLLEGQKRHPRATLSAAIEERIDNGTKELRSHAEEFKRYEVREREQQSRFAQSAAYHAALKQKYLRAARRPWRFVEPDPPPPDPSARGNYWEERRDFQRARDGYEEAVRDEPENAGSLNNLAWFLATCPDATVRDGKRAALLARRACELSDRQNSSFLDTLAAALAESGDFQAAIETQREAIGLLSNGDSSANDFHAHLEAYEARRVFRAEHKEAK
jgi:tetratricopeptide (TPR) repeat protein